MMIHSRIPALVFSIAGALAARACGQPSADHDAIGIYFTIADHCTCADMAAFFQDPAYLVITSPTRPVASFACRLRVEPASGYFGSWTADAAWFNAAVPPVFDCSPVGDPITGDDIVLASINFLVVNDTIAHLFYIDPPEGEDEVAYTDPDGEPTALTRYSGLYPGNADAIVNPHPGCWCYIANEPLSWSSIKTLYR
ncbi:hypothetical protein KKG45_13710 [bacterium]|nr:hypothetical protein [bacterium]MBU1074297.1 hypothetical protein [bacterium]MBU1674606.1 hypothetical protein [bacterium]